MGEITSWGQTEVLKPLEMHCPLDGHLETVTHSCGLCWLLTAAFDLIQKCFPVGTMAVHMLTTCSVELSLSTPQGILAWSAVFVNWKLRCPKKFVPAFRPTWAIFVTNWISLAEVLAHRTSSSAQPQPGGLARLPWCSGRFSGLWQACPSGTMSPPPHTTTIQRTA